jgi:hypothetical protein
LVEQLLPQAQSLGRAGRTEVFRWQDPSGARLVFEVRAGAVEGILPSYDALPGAELAELMMVDDAVAIGDVMEDGQVATRLAVEVEERRLGLGKRHAYRGPVSVVGLGVGVELFEDADVFAQSPASLLHGSEQDVPEPPPHVVEFGLPWPPRMAAESLVSYGVWAEPHDVDAYARLNGTVLGASTRTVELTERSFHAVRVRTAGFDCEVCLPIDRHPELPRTGQVIGGMMFMVGSLGAVPDSRRGRFHLPGRSV